MSIERDASWERSLDDYKQREESDRFDSPSWKPSAFMGISILAEYVAQGACRMLQLPWGYWATRFRRSDWILEHGKD